MNNHLTSQPSQVIRSILTKDNAIYIRVFLQPPVVRWSDRSGAIGQWVIRFGN